MIYGRGTLGLWSESGKEQSFSVPSGSDSLVCHPLALSNAENCGTPEIYTRNVETGPDQGLNGNVQVPELRTNTGAGFKDCRVALTPAPRVPSQRGLARSRGVRHPGPNYTSSYLRFHKVLRGGFLGFLQPRTN